MLGKMAANMGKPIESYAVIGDCRTAALISNDGSLDWLCWPRFDSPSIFGRLLDPEGGHWLIRPVGEARIRREYVQDTNVLETCFSTDQGDIVIADFMPVASEEDKARMLLPEHEVTRWVRCENGEVEIKMEFAPRPGYGMENMRGLKLGAGGIRLQTNVGLLTLRSDRDLSDLSRGDGKLQFTLSVGNSACFSLTLANQWPAVFAPHEEIRRSLFRTTEWWRRWVSKLRYEGPYHAAVVRSALTLKLFVFAPSGAVVAAPTTSLPERPHGDLNWDYRFCWLRDASMTVRALFGLGFGEEAEAFMSWLLHATRLTQPELKVLYDVYGNAPEKEHILLHWRGFARAGPVRVGNAADNQFQLDVYGEVIDAAAEFVIHGGRFDRDTRRMLRLMGEYVCRHWDQKDEGIWEPRSGRAHNTHSKVLCWVALDRILGFHEQGLLPKIPVDLFRKNRRMIREDVMARGWNENLQSYVARYDGTALDASLLLLGWYGFEAASAPRMIATGQAITRELGEVVSADSGAETVLLYRYRTSDSSGDSPGEGAFGIASFWLAEYLALGGGTLEQAENCFAGLLRCANDIGLYAEEIDPHSLAAWGNFPQAFTHVGLINAALTLERRRHDEQPAGIPAPLHEEASHEHR